MINHILATSRIPWILEQKSIEVEGNLLSVDINPRHGVDAHLYRVQDVLKFEGWEYQPYRNKSNDFVGRLIAEFEGITFVSCVSANELEQLNIEN